MHVEYSIPSKTKKLPEDQIPTLLPIITVNKEILDNFKKTVSNSEDTNSSELKLEFQHNDIYNQVLNNVEDNRSDSIQIVPQNDYTMPPPPETAVEMIEVSEKGPPFRCTLCDRHYSRRSCLRAHIKEDHLEKGRLFSCSLCDKVFSKGKLLRAHIKRHKENNVELNSLTTALTSLKKGDLEAKQFSCSSCNYKFSTSGGLKNHEIIHWRTPWRHLSKGEDKPLETKQFNCSSCNYKSSTVSGLKRHEIIHSGRTTWRPLSNGEDKHIRKKEQNIHSAKRYREKQKLKQQQLEDVLVTEEKRNQSLKQRLKLLEEAKTEANRMFLFSERLDKDFILGPEVTTDVEAVIDHTIDAMYLPSI